MNVQDVDLNLLRVFDAVLHERGVTPAAARLGLTQPAVSNALARLRALFGDPLFVRTPRGMDATPFARELAEPVRQALALLESALAHGPGFDPATSTRAFRFYMSDLGQIEFLPPLVERVQRVAPGVRLEAVALDVEDIGDALAAGALDLAVGFLPGLGRAGAAPGAVPRSLRLPDARRPPDRQHADQEADSSKRRTRWSPTAAATASSRRRSSAPASRARIALRVPHFTVVPMVLERTDLILTLPARVARVYERRGKLQVAAAAGADPAGRRRACTGTSASRRDPGNRWLRELIVELFGS